MESTDNSSSMLKISDQEPQYCNVCGRSMLSSKGAYKSNISGLSFCVMDDCSDVYPELTQKTYYVCVVCLLRALGVNIPVINKEVEFPINPEFVLPTLNDIFDFIMTHHKVGHRIKSEDEVLSRIFGWACPGCNVWRGISLTNVVMLKDVVLPSNDVTFNDFVRTISTPESRSKFLDDLNKRIKSGL